MRLDTLCSVGVSEGAASQRDVSSRVETAYLKVSSSARSQWTPETGHMRLTISRTEGKLITDGIEGAHEMAAIMAVFEFPPSDSFNNQVKIESRYGTKSSFFFFPLTVSLA
jgi:hypothetical protein